MCFSYQLATGPAQDCPPTFDEFTTVNVCLKVLSDDPQNSVCETCQSIVSAGRVSNEPRVVWDAESCVVLAMCSPPICLLLIGCHTHCSQRLSLSHSTCDLQSTHAHIAHICQLHRKTTFRNWSSIYNQMPIVTKQIHQWVPMREWNIKYSKDCSIKAFPLCEAQKHSSSLETWCLRYLSLWEYRWYIHKRPDLGSLPDHVCGVDCHIIWYEICYLQALL